mmetsp:Transcript_4084/g.5448  ORF Transcript_4084/g.5448 Transcript_4084/m.5448 type:complete len:798 (-) Transcript_4084:704-3097(-)
MTKASPRIPPELHSINAFIRHADKLGNDDPESRIVAHYCRMHAAQEGMLYATSDEGKQYLSELLDEVESEMDAVSIITPEESYILCRNHADRIFEKADAEDKKGNSGEKTAEIFDTAATFYEVLAQFHAGDVGEEPKNTDQMEEELKLEYCRKRAVAILNEIEEQERLQSNDFIKEYTSGDASVSSLSSSDAGIRDHDLRGPPPSFPPELDTIKPFVSRAQYLDDNDNGCLESPIIAHYCRLHAVQIGMPYATSEKGKEYIAYLLGYLEDKGEAVSIITTEESHVICRNHADRIFSSADAQDKIFSPGEDLAEMFESAATFYEILGQFHGVNAQDQKTDEQREEESRMKHCRRRALEIMESIEKAKDIENDVSQRVDNIFSPELKLAQCEKEDCFGNEEESSMGSSDTPNDESGNGQKVARAIPAASNPFNEDGSDFFEFLQQNNTIKVDAEKKVEPAGKEFTAVNILPLVCDPSNKEDPNRSFTRTKGTVVKQRSETVFDVGTEKYTDEVVHVIGSTDEVVHVIDQLDDEVDAMDDFNKSMISVMDEEALGNLVHFTDEEAEFWSKMGFSVEEAVVADSMDIYAPEPKAKPKLLRPSILQSSFRAASKSTLMENKASADPNARDGYGLPLGGEHFKATLKDGHFGAIFFRASEMRHHLYCSAPSSFVKALKNRPVVAYTSNDSVIDSAGISLGDVIIRVQDVEVKSPKNAMTVVHMLRNEKSSFHGIELAVWRPPSSINVKPSQNQCMVEYHSRKTDVPPSSAGWKPKYVVVEGIVSKPHVIDMYYNKVSAIFSQS